MEDFGKWILFFGLMVVVVVPGLMYALPQYNVYASRLSGEAQLAHAQAEREVQVKDAQGKFEAATHLANAEIERAKGVAKANQIIGESLKNNEPYLRYLWIHNLEVGNNSVVYVPTEAGLPILEAGRRK